MILISFRLKSGEKYPPVETKTEIITKKKEEFVKDLEGHVFLDERNDTSPCSKISKRLGCLGQENSNG